MCTVSAQSVTLREEGGAGEAGEARAETRPHAGRQAPTSLQGLLSGAAPEAEAASRGEAGLAASQPLSSHCRGIALQCIAMVSDDCNDLCVMRDAIWQLRCGFCNTGNSTPSGWNSCTQAQALTTTLQSCCSLVS